MISAIPEGKRSNDLCSCFLHNLLIDIGDKEELDVVRNDDEREQARQVMSAYNQLWDRTKAEVALAESKRESYAIYYYHYDAEDE
ncbi:hypothetical protein PHPALM_871 [Phytophthora palmivora]|uniref:Uncharacterized protein n=1 Tax=Phytophthora palmivora TaxID=4796 RepID=A0A2P4YTS7_9STRA|nr:hypothetical protein PHPALM_871 [Phytophthora palmivora]